jgi:hypothetical protein
MPHSFCSLHYSEAHLTMGDDDGGDNVITNWSCCNDEQTLFLLLYIAYVFLALITWKTLIAKPIRLIAVFIHEWCHAIACWITCGDVHRINVFENEGGVTTFAGGCRCLIIPAGYVGCSIISMIFVILSGGRTTSLIGCIVFTISLLITLCYSPNKITVYICLGYTLLNICIIVADYYWYNLLLQLLFLYYGVTIGIFSIADTYDDTVAREAKGSDSVACQQEVCIWCPSKFIGLQWAILAIFFQLIGMWFALVAMSPECEDLSWMNCMDGDNNNGDGNGNNIFEIWDFDFEGWWHQATESIKWD